MFKILANKKSQYQAAEDIGTFGFLVSVFTFNPDFFFETTACEKPLFTVEVFVFEHFMYSSADFIVIISKSAVNAFYE
jgi:hypothetical protein